MNAWQAAGNWGFLFMAVGLLLLGTSFLGFTRWRKTWSGRGIGAFFISTNAIIILSVLRLFQVLKPTDLWYWILRAIVFLGGGAAVLVVGIAFIRFQLIRRRSGAGAKPEIRVD